MEQPGQNNLRSAKFSNLLLLVGGPEMCERRDPDRVALVERQAKPAKEVQVQNAGVQMRTAHLKNVSLLFNIFVEKCLALKEELNILEQF